MRKPRRLRSQAAIALFRPALCGYTLLTTNTSSRRPAIALRDDLLRPAVAVHLRGVDERHAEIDARAQRGRSPGRARRVVRPSPRAQARAPERARHRGTQRDEARLQGLGGHSIADSAWPGCRGSRGSEVECGVTRPAATIWSGAADRPSARPRPMPDSTLRRVMSRRLPARLPGHLRDARHRRERPRGRDSRRAGSSADRRHAVHEGRALPRSHVFDRARAPSRCGASGARAKAASTRIGWDEALDTIADAFARDRRVAGRAAGDRPLQLCGTMGLLQSARWTGASSIGSARRCSTGRSARRPARPGWAAVIGAAMGTDVEQFVEQPADPDLGQQSDRRRTCTSGRARRRRSAAARSSSRSIPTAARPPRSATSTSRCCPAPTPRSRSAMMHVLIDEGLVDRDYIDRYTVGFDALAARARRISARARRRDLRHRRRSR